METLTKSSIKSLFKPRVASSHKGNHGHALIIAGSTGRIGAAVIAARACLRSGTGLLTVSVPMEERFILQTTIPEAMLVMRDDEALDLSPFSALGIGPGIGTDTVAEKLLIRILSDFKKPLLLDADALNIISVNKDLLKMIPTGTVITPHPKEFDRLFGTHESIEDRIKTAVNQAKELQIIIVLKGHRTLITSQGQSFVNITGNAGLAKGGSGDALTGIITALLAQGYNPFDAAKLGVFIHGLSADIALRKQSLESMLITDVIEYLGKAFRYIEAL
ncbi:MAG: NAD(P)H-hydrate dehydratase [Bacteroidota bacterium]|jgi:NAD(P)H-hydrate epimerase